MTPRAFALVLMALTAPAMAFDSLGGRSYADTRYMNVGLGAGATGFARQKGIDGDLGFGLRLTAGHALNRFVDIQFNYQFSNFDLRSPDPLDPTARVGTNASMHQESIVAALRYPRYFAQPYVSAGVGGYAWTGVDRETTLSFPMNVFFPLAAGVRTYLVRNFLSFDAEFSYQWILGEDQDADTLALIGASEVAFDTYSVTGTLQFHLF